MSLAFSLEEIPLPEEFPIEPFSPATTAATFDEEIVYEPVAIQEPLPEPSTYEEAKAQGSL